MFLRCAILISVFSSTLAAGAAQQPYTFISADDLYDALAQESMILQGYTLGVADSFKHSGDLSACFTIPLRPDADQVIFTTFIEYWANAKERPASSVDAITEMMVARFPCEADPSAKSD